MRTITRTTNPNGTYRYEIDGEVAYKASKVLYTHATTYSVGTEGDPVLFHKTESAANKATGYTRIGWVKTGVQAIEDGDATATVAQHALTIANLAAVLMEQGRLRVSKGLSSGAITTTLDIARGNQATRAAGIALAHGHDRDIREAFQTSVPPAVTPVVEPTHSLKCTENCDIAPGVRMQRRWNCTCGEWTSYGYDNAVKAAFKDHLVTSEPTPATEVATVDLWETFEGQTHGYDAAGNRVIEISERVRDTVWTVATNVRSWAVLGDGITRHGVLASGTADGLRAAKKAALAAFAEVMATPAPEPLKVPRNGAKVVANAGPTHVRGRQGRVQSKGTGDDGNLYVTVDFGAGGTWPFLVHELTLV